MTESGLAVSVPRSKRLRVDLPPRFPLMKKTLFFTLGCAALAAAAFANGTRLPYMDIDTVARGYAHAATADSPSAIYYNPAGTAQLKEGALQGGVFFLQPENRFRATGRDTKAKSETFALPYLFATQPLSFGGTPLTLGAAAYSPFGLSSEWATTSGFRTLATRNELVYRRYALSLSSTVAPGLMLGASAQYNRVHVDLNRGIGFVPTDSVNITTRGTTWSYNLGLIYQPSPQHSFGVQYQSESDVSLAGTAGYQPLNVTEGARLTLPFPDSYTISYSFRPTPEWNFEIGLDRTRWHRLGTVVVARPSGPLFLPFNWKDSSYVEAGGTYFWKSGWNASAGLCRSGNSVPDTTFNPAIVDYDRWLWNAGVGYRTKQWRVSTVVQFSPEHTRDVRASLRSPAGESADGSYISKLFAFGVQAEVRW